MEKRIAIVLLSFSFFYGKTQNVDPASRGYYSEAITNGYTTQTGGSARVVGMAGAQTALGADLGAGSSNPAGLGVYRKSEIGGGLSLNIMGSNSSLYNTDIRDVKPNLSVNNLGVAFCFLKDDIVESKWRGGTFSISMNTMQTYHNRYSYEGVNNQNTMIYSLTEQAEGTNASVYDKEYTNQNITSLPSLAYSTFLITPDNSNTYYYGYIPPDKVMNQKGTVVTSGAVRNWNFGYGGNYDNRLFFGASLGISVLRRNTEQTYTETLVNGGQGYLNDFTLSDKRQVRGTGFNLRIGAIYRFNDVFRLGASIKTPDWYSIKEQYDASLNARFNNIVLTNSDGSDYILANESANLTTAKFNYQYSSPLKANLGGSFFFGKRGFLTLEGEYVNYSGMLLSTNSGSYFNGDNRSIKNLYSNVVNLRSGLELRFDALRIRGGLAVLPSPYANNVDDRIKRSIADAAAVFSLGIGFKFDELSLDFAYSRTSYTSNYSPYVLYSAPYAGTQPLVKTNQNLNNIVVTLSGNF